ncbi:hypothetical protein F5890DRAFT_95021 [Lentinula detonsa]|uniref:Uncharacterized protein n=1 Tax=Lentinula detonsa TaxID=2804962 RepID=A0AA38PYJ0_9AGAR|nr:hypothetical protein F5890DRAFT_95021 [Lentinula detonsa]
MTRLVPPLVKAGKISELVQSGCCCILVTSDKSRAVYIAPLELSTSKTSTIKQDEAVCFATDDDVPSSERRLFIADTLVILSMLKSMHDAKLLEIYLGSWSISFATSILHKTIRLQTRQALEIIRKLSIDYIDFIEECWIHAFQPLSRPKPLQSNFEHYCNILLVMNLAL